MRVPMEMDRESGSEPKEEFGEMRVIVMLQLRVDGTTREGAGKKGSCKSGTKEDLREI